MHPVSNEEIFRTKSGGVTDKLQQDHSMATNTLEIKRCKKKKYGDLW